MSYFVEILKNAWQDDFLKGMMVGIGGYIVLVLLVHLLFIIFRGKKRCTSFIIPGENGAIIVSIKAVTGVLQQELAHFSQLEITRINVFKAKKDYHVEVRGRFLAGNSGTPEIYTGISDEIKQKMNSIFGIENISKIDLRIDTCKIDEEKSNTDLIFTPGMR